MVLVALLVVRCLFKDPLDGGGASPVTSSLAATTVLALSTLLVAVVNVALLFDALFARLKKSPTAGPRF